MRHVHTFHLDDVSPKSEGGAGKLAVIQPSGTPSGVHPLRGVIPGVLPPATVRQPSGLVILSAEHFHPAWRTQFMVEDVGID
jgi:hypothetical protein